MRMGWVDMPSDSPVEMLHLMELLNSDQQESDVYCQPVQPLVERANTGIMVPNVVGAENRFVAHISQAMSKANLSLLGVSEVDY
jgi:hypothetical protein